MFKFYADKYIKSLHASSGLDLEFFIEFCKKLFHQLLVLTQLLSFRMQKNVLHVININAMHDEITTRDVLSKLAMA